MESVDAPSDRPPGSGPGSDRRLCGCHGNLCRHCHRNISGAFLSELQLQRRHVVAIYHEQGVVGRSTTVVTFVSSGERRGISKCDVGKCSGADAGKVIFDLIGDDLVCTRKAH